MEKNKKTKILAIGDIHGDVARIQRLASKAKYENVDVIILAGDFTWAGQSIKNIIGPFAGKNKHVLLVPGNHETASLTGFLAQLYKNTTNLHGYSFTANNVGFFGAGGVNIGMIPTMKSEMFNLLKKGHDEIKDLEKKIMVTHMHHRGGKAEIFGWEGSSAITDAIKEFKPDILISAHIHEAAGVEEIYGDTRIINVSRKEKVFEI